MLESNARRKRDLITLAATTAIAIAIAVWNLRGNVAAPPPVAAADIGDARAAAAAVASNTATQHTRITPKASSIMLQARTPLPSPGTSLATVYDELKRRADAGDAEAATRLFHEVHRCVAVRQTRRLLAEMPSAVETPGHPDDRSLGVIYYGQAPEIKRVREMTDYIEANDARCAGATDAQLASFTPLLLQAAQLGDLKALDCYVGTDFERMDGLLDHPEWIDTYRSQVPGLVESALHRGDWVIVDLLHHAYGGAFDTSARGQLFGTDRVRDYRLLRLEQLGATGAFADKLAPLAAAAARALSPAQALDSEAWANDYYSRYFNSVSDEVSNGANICQIGDD